MFQIPPNPETPRNNPAQTPPLTWEEVRDYAIDLKRAGASPQEISHQLLQLGLERAQYSQGQRR